jgi:hypothetical protein
VIELREGLMILRISLLILFNVEHVYFININLYNCNCDYLYSFCVVCPLLCA